MNIQETFDTICKGIIAQGGPSMTGMICAYRAFNGRKCAAGLLIPDEKYDPVFETWTPERVEGSPISAILCDILEAEGHSLEMVLSMQSCHDRAANANSDEDFLIDFKRRARQIARLHNLHTDVLS